MHDLNSTAGIVAIVAAGVAFLALVTTLVLALRLRRVRSDQKVVLGERAEDLVAHAAGLESRFSALSRYVEDAAKQLEDRMT